jgi:abequosyltransferase
MQASEDLAPIKTVSATIMRSLVLSICIPTHDGRGNLLSELLHSIFRQMDTDLVDLIEVCISDNGSQDNTREIISEARTFSPCKLSYHRYDKNEGLRNFQHVINMANGDYCWMIGSDDILPPGSIRSIVEIIYKNKDAAGFTINKLNFNADYSALIGPDNDVVLPSDWATKKKIFGFDNILTEMCFLLSFISAHILKKTEWDLAIEEMGWHTFERMRHFAFSAVLAKIIKNSDEWIWIPDFLITQRIGNSCLVDDLGDLGFAIQCTVDMQSFIERMLLDVPNAKKVKNILQKKLFLLYWNPILVLKYKSGSHATFLSDRQMLRFCVKSFLTVPLFWFTTFFVLLLPGFVAPPLQVLAKGILNIVRRKQLEQARSLVGPGLDHTASAVLALACAVKLEVSRRGLDRK